MSKVCAQFCIDFLMLFIIAFATQHKRSKENCLYYKSLKSDNNHKSLKNHIAHLSSILFQELGELGKIPTKLCNAVSDEKFNQPLKQDVDLSSEDTIIRHSLCKHVQ